MDQAAQEGAPQIAPSAIFEALRRVNLEIASAPTSEAMLSGVLDQVLDIFDCDRAWLLYPCSPSAEWTEVPMERTRPAWPGSLEMGQRMPASEGSRAVFRACLQAPGPLAIQAGEAGPVQLPPEVIERFQIRSQMMMAIHPRDDEPWLFGIHHCEKPCNYDGKRALFQAIGARLADGLTTHLANRELRDSEERFRTLVEHSPEAIVLFDLDEGVFIDANSEAERLFGTSREEMVFKLGPVDFSPQVQADGRPSALAARDKIESALQGRTAAFEWTHTNAKGEAVPCEVRLVRLPHKDRTLLRGSITDISARKKAEAERADLQARLIQSQKLEAIGQLTGGVAHDFNNHLTVILGNLELAKEALHDPERARGYIEQATAGARRASSLNHRLLAFARRQPLRPKAVDVGRLLKDMDELLRRTLGEQVQVEIVLGGGLWTCEVDRTQLENAVLNLAINARDAMPGGGKLTIEAGNTRLDADYAQEHEEVSAGQYVLLAVTDSGTGIPKDILDNIFTPFFTTKDVGKGSGLGLSMVYGFVKQSGGHVKAYSESGVGTTIKMYLPRSHDEAGEEASASPQGMPMGQGEWVLLVEDAADVRRLTRALLAQLGYRVLEARKAEEALAVLAQHPEVQMILTDVILPGGMTGADLARAAAPLYPDLRVLYMSGYTENAILHNGRLDPGVVLLEKPFSKRALARRVREVLDA